MRVRNPRDDAFETRGSPVIMGAMASKRDCDLEDSADVRTMQQEVLFRAPDRFQPHSLLRGAHRQTMFSFFVPPRIPYRARTFLIKMSDGDRVVLHDDCPRAWPENGRIVLLVHGLAGCHTSPYVVRVADRLCNEGYRTLRMDMRGCGAGVHLAKGVFHADRAADLLLVCQSVARRHPHARLTLCGFSLGANLTLKMLGKFWQQMPDSLDSAIAVEPPIDLSYCCQRLPEGWGWIYDHYFTRRLWQDFCRRRSQLRDAERVRTRRNPGTLLRFDELITAPLAGFRTAAEYYETASSKDVLHDIRIPTAVVAAEDDPIVRPEIYHAANWSATTQAFMVAEGGHLGFVASGSKRLTPVEHWLDTQIVNWVRQASRRA